MAKNNNQENKQGITKLVVFIILLIILFGAVGYGGWKLGISYAENQAKETKTNK